MRIRSTRWWFPALLTSSLMGCHEVQHPETRPARYGWDYGLIHRCIHGPHPQSANYYEDLRDCPAAGKAWTIAVQSETTSAGYGPTDQSFPINVPDSPVHLEWIPTANKSGLQQRVQLVTDFETITHPGGEGYFTWFVLMDHTAYGGGPFPQPHELLSKVQVLFSDSTPNGATRAFVGTTATWDGKMHGIEVCFAIKNWGDAYPDPDIIAHIKNETLEFVLMDGAAMGITAPRNQETPLEFRWHKIVQDLVHRSYFTPPKNGWNQTQTATVYVGTEVNNFKASNAARASLSIMDFKVERAIK